jgi:hypothetical protein
MKKIKIYQLEEVEFRRDLNYWNHYISESDHPELMRDKSSNYHQGEKVRIINRIGRDKVSINAGIPSYLEKKFLNTLDEIKIPYKLCENIHAYWVEIPKEYFEINKLKEQTI